MTENEEKKEVSLVKDESGTLIVTDQAQERMLTPKPPEGLVPDARNMFMLAEGLARSKMFPDVQDKFQALAKIEYGRELGIPPVISLNLIHIVKGRLGVESKVFLALIEKAGVKVTFVERTKKKSKIRFEMPGKDPYEETFTWQDAEKIKDPQGKPLTKKDNYLNYPEELLTWRCLAKGARVYCAGIILGLYTLDEMTFGERADVYQEIKSYDKAQEEMEKKKRGKKEDKPNATDTAPPEAKAPASPPEDKPKKEPAKKPEVIDKKSPAATVTHEERIEMIKTDILEDFMVRFGQEHQQVNPDLSLSDYVKVKYQNFKSFLKYWQDKKNEDEGKDLCFVGKNEYGHLSLSEGNPEHIALMWEKGEKRNYTLEQFYEWMKFPQEEQEDEKPPF